MEGNADLCTGVLYRPERWGSRDEGLGEGLDGLDTMHNDDGRQRSLVGSSVEENRDRGGWGVVFEVSK